MTTDHRVTRAIEMDDLGELRRLAGAGSAYADEVLRDLTGE